MRVLQGSRTLQAELGPYAVAIGIFDGVHLGHQALLRCAVENAERENIASLAFTFHPHPATVLAPKKAPLLLDPIEVRIERMNGLGVNAALVEPFDREFASQAPEDFVSEILAGKLQARHVIVGEGFSFGHRGLGNVELLKTLGEEHGFEVHAIAPVTQDDAIISSTRIRERVAAGDMAEAHRLLGHAYEIRGAVVRGQGRGTGIGVPTANINPENEQIPGVGVYAGWASGPVDRSPAVINIGHSPTFGEGELRVEAHLLEYAGGPLYGSVMSVELLHKLRDEMKFDGVDALKAQIVKDIDRAKDTL